MIKTITNLSKENGILDISVDSCIVTDIFGEREIDSAFLPIRKSMTNNDLLFVKVKINNFKEGYKFAKFLFNIYYEYTYSYFTFKIHPVQNVDFSNENILNICANASDYSSEELYVTPDIENSLFIYIEKQKAVFDLTSIVEKYINSNNEFMFFISNNCAANDNFKIYLPKGNDNETCISVITEDDGIDERNKYEQYDLGLLGNYYINLAYGSGIYINNLFKTSSFIMPIDFSLFYNKKLEKSFMLDGQRHSFELKLYHDSEYGTICMEDPSGKKSYYKTITENEELKSYLEIDSTTTISVIAYNYVDNSYLIMCEKNGKPDIRVKFKDGSSIGFNKFNLSFFQPTDFTNKHGDKLNFEYSGRFLEHIFGCSNNIYLYYNADDTLSYIDFFEENRQFKFEYNANSLRINFVNVTYRDIDSDLVNESQTEVVDYIELFFNSNNFIVKHAASNKEFYAEYLSNKINSAYMKDTSSSNYLFKDTYQYSNKLTKKNNFMNKAMYYYFDNYGRIIKEMDYLGRTRSYSYYVAENGDPTNVKDESGVQVSSRNYILNHGFEIESLSSDEKYGWKENTNTNSSVNIVDGGLLGKKCLSIKTGINGMVEITQKTLELNQDKYKLNFFVKNSKYSSTDEIKVTVELLYKTYSYEVSNYLDCRKVLTASVEQVNSNWTKCSTDEFTIPYGAIDITSTIKIIVSGSNMDVYFDNFYFEGVKYNSRYNLVENGYMEYIGSNNIPEGWTYVSPNSDGSIIEYTHDDEHLPSFGKNVFYIDAKECNLYDTYTLEKRVFLQTVNCSGNSGDYFTFSSLIKANVTSNTDFFVKLIFNYETLGEKYYKFRIAENMDCWQMLTKSIRAEDNYDSIIIWVEFSGIGDVYLDCFQLYKEYIGSYYGYDDMDNLTEVTNQNKTLKISYDKNQIIEIKMPNGKQINFEYDDKKRMIKKSELGLYTIIYTYDTLNRIIEEMIVLNNGRTFTKTYAYYDDQKLCIITNFDNSTSSYRYDILNQTTRVTNSNNYSTNFEYNNKQQLTHLFNSNVDRFFEYTSLGQIKKIDDIERNIDYTYDEFGRTINCKLDENIVIANEYSNSTDGINHGQVTKIIDSLKGSIYAFEYNDEGNITAIYLNDQKINEIVYDENDRIFSEKEYSNNQLTSERIYEYNNSNQIVNTFESNGLMKSYHYDNLGSLQKVVYKLNNQYSEVEYEYPYEFTEYTRQGFINRLLNIYNDDIVTAEYGHNGYYGTESILPSTLIETSSLFNFSVFSYSDCYDTNCYDLKTTNSKRTDFISTNNTMDKDSWNKKFAYNKTFYAWIYPLKTCYEMNLFAFQNRAELEDEEVSTILSYLKINSDKTLGYCRNGSTTSSFSTSTTINALEWNLIGIRFFKEEGTEKTKCFIIINDKISDIFEITENVLDINCLLTNFGNEPIVTTTTTTSGKTLTSTSNDLKTPYKMCLLSIGAYNYTEREIIGIYNESKKYLLTENLSDIKSSTTLFYDPNAYSGYDVITLNGSLESQNKNMPVKIFRNDDSYSIEKSKLFKYDTILNRHVYGCFDTDNKLIRSSNSLLGYKLNLSNTGQFGFRFRLDDNIVDSNTYRCICSFVKDDLEVFGIYYNDQKKIVLSSMIYNEEDETYTRSFKSTSISITDTLWHHLIIKFDLLSTILKIDNTSYNYSKILNLSDTIMYLGSTSISASNIKNIRGYFEMLAYRQTIDKNYSSINSNHKSFMTRKKYNVLGSCYQEEFKVNNNSYTIDYEYDMLRPSKQIIDLCDETQIYDSIEYSYDVIGNITSQIFKLQDETVKSKTLQYDELNNLIYQTDNEGNSITYFYDDFGNIDKKEIIQNGIEVTYVYNYDQSIHDKLLSISNYETEEVIYELKYEGVSQYLPTKLIKNGTENILIWDNGLLTRFNNITFEYDQTGNRLKKTIGTTSTNYYYDGNKLIYEVKEINGVKQTPQEYIYNNDGQVIAIKYNNNYYFYVRDLLGNIIGLLDTNYKFVVEYHYSDYGEILEINGSKASTLGIDNPFKYKGYYYDVETSLFWLYSRYYSPELCRFIQPADVSTLNPSSINGLNLYSYANNNPIGIAYRANISTINGMINTNLQFNTLVPIFNQIPVNNSSISLKPLTFSVGLVTPDNPKLPKWMDLSAFYISGHLGFGGGYSKSPGEKGSFGLSFASLDLGIVSMKADVVTFDDDTSLYLGLGALNANASLGLGLSANVEIVSFYFGAKLNDYVSIDGKVYVGWGISFDFSNGVKIGIAAGVGFEIAINF